MQTSGLPNDKKLAALRARKEQLLAQLRQREAQVTTAERKRDARAKIIIGAAMMATPAGEREALLGMVLPRLAERERGFVLARLPKM